MDIINTCYILIISIYIYIYQYSGGVFSLLSICLASSVHGNTSNLNMTELRLVL